MASSTQQVLTVAADAAGGGPSPAAAAAGAAGQVGVGTAALIALCTSVATFALQFVLRTIALGRWQGQVEARITAVDLRVSERHREAEDRAADRQIETDRRITEMSARIGELKGDMAAAIEGLCERQEDARRELLEEIRLLRERGPGRRGEG